MTIENIAKSLLKTLDEIDVRGRENMDKMLGCMLLLEKVLQAIKEGNGEGTEDDHNDQPRKDV